MTVHQDIGIVVTMPTKPPGYNGASGVYEIVPMQPGFEDTGKTVSWTRDYQGAATVWNDSTAPFTILGGDGAFGFLISGGVQYLELYVNTQSGTTADTQELGDLVFRVIDGNGVPASLIAVVGQVGAPDTSGGSEGYLRVWDENASSSSSQMEPVLHFVPKSFSSIAPVDKPGTFPFSDAGVLLPEDDVEAWVEIDRFSNSNASPSFGGFPTVAGTYQRQLFAPFNIANGEITGKPVTVEGGSTTEPYFLGGADGVAHFYSGEASSSSHIYIGDTLYSGASKPDYNTGYQFTVDSNGNYSTASPIHNQGPITGKVYQVDTLLYEGPVQIWAGWVNVGYATNPNIKFTLPGEYTTKRWEMMPPTSLQQATTTSGGVAASRVVMEDGQLYFYYFHSAYSLNNIGPWFRTRIPIEYLDTPTSGAVTTIPQVTVDALTTEVDPINECLSASGLPASTTGYGYIYGGLPGGLIWGASGESTSWFRPTDGSTPTELGVLTSGNTRRDSNGWWLKGNAKATSDPVGPSGTTYNIDNAGIPYYFLPADFTAGDKPTGIACIEGYGISDSDISLYDYGLLTFYNEYQSSSDRIKIRLYGEGPWGTSTRTTAALAPEVEIDISESATTGKWGIVKMPANWTQFDETVIPGTGGGGGGTSYEIVPGIDLPYSLDWPAEMYEGDTVTGLWEVTSPGILNQAEFEILNPATGKWETTPFDTTDNYGEPERSGLNLPGMGTVWIEQEMDNWPDETSESAIPEPTTAEIEFKPNDQFWGTVEFSLRAKGYVKHSADSYDFSYEYSPTKLVTVNMVNEPDRPRVSGDGFPETIEEVAVSSSGMTVEDPDNSGNYTWELSADHQPDTWESGDPDFRTNTSTTSVTVTDDDGYTAGTVAVSSQSGTTVTLTYTPEQYWNGQTEVWVRVDNNTGAEKSRWRRLPIKVEPVENQPTAPTPTDFGTFNEDTTKTLAISWTDPDVGPTSRKGIYEAEFRLTGDTYWIPVAVEQVVDLGNIRVRLTAFDSDAMTAELRAEPKANWNGTFDFDFRLKDNSGGADNVLYSPVVAFTGTVASRPDTPTIVVPSKMPRCKPGGVAFGRFSTFDPDTEDTFWRFEISTTGAEDGAWLDTLTTDQGTIELDDIDETDQQCIVKFTSDGQTVGSYSFWIRVIDSTGRSSTPTLVSGVVAGSHTAAWLQYLDRTTTPATVRMLCPLTTATGIQWTHALDGPGAASVTVTAQELRTRAAQLDTTVESLLDAGRVELRITTGGATTFVGPVASTTVDSTGRNPLVTINAAGLLSYTEGALLAGSQTDPTATTTFGLADQSEIVADLFTQDGFSDSYAIADGTTGSGVSSIVDFQNTSTIGECLASLRNEPGAAEVWVDNDRVLRAAAARGSDKRSTTRLSSTLATAVERAAKSDEVVTACVVTSALGFHGFHQDPTQVERYGRLTRLVTADALTSNASCTNLAREVVDRSKARSEVVTLSLYVTEAAPFNAADLEPGDVVTLAVNDAQLGNLSGAFRLLTTTVEVGPDKTPPGAFLVTVSAEPAVWDGDGRLQGSRSRLTSEFYSMSYEALYR